MTDNNEMREPLLSGFEEKVEDEDWKASLVAVEVRYYARGQKKIRKQESALLYVTLATYNAFQDFSCYTGK